MGNIERFSNIKREALSGEHYLQSLLGQAYLAQLLTEEELEKIQIDCLALLAKKTKRFSSGDSSSIRTEKAQEILASIFFTVGVFLKTFQSPDDAVAALQGMGVEAACAEGRKRIDNQLSRARTQHRMLVSHLLHTKNEFYSATIVDGIIGFFKIYDADYSAQEIHITADYPEYNKTERLAGIEFILQYLKQLYYENMFCKHFSDEDIHRLLCGYDEHYEDLLFNLYEPVLATALGCVLAGASANSLAITPEMQSFLHSRLAGKSSGEVEQLLDDALESVAQSFDFSDNLTAYVKQSLPQLAATIEGGVRTGILERIFIVPRGGG